MRIAYLCLDPGIPIPSDKGASVHVLAFAHALSLAGHAVTLVARSRGPSDPALLEGVALRVLDDEASLGDALAGHDLVVERYSLGSLAGLLAAQSRGIRYVLEVNAPLVEEAARYRSVTPTESLRGCEERLLREAYRVLVVSRALAAFAVRAGASSERVCLFRNAVDPEPFSRAEPAEIPALSPGDFPLVFVSGLRPWHGVSLLLESFARLSSLDPSYRLLVVGSGPLSADVDRFARGSEAAGGVIRLGRVPSRSIPGILARSRIALCPYEDLPNFYFCPLKIFEYLAAGLPVVATGVGDLPEILGDGKRGVLVRPGDAAAFASAIDALRRDPPRSRALADAGRRWVVQSETWAHRVRTLEEIAGVGVGPRSAS